MGYWYHGKETLVSIKSVELDQLTGH